MGPAAGSINIAVESPSPLSRFTDFRSSPLYGESVSSPQELTTLDKVLFWVLWVLGAAVVVALLVAFLKYCLY